MKKLIKDYFSFSRQDRNAVLLLGTIVTSLLVYSTYFRAESVPEEVPITQTIKSEQSRQSKETRQEVSLDSLVIQAFDPNTLDQEKAVAMGLSAKLGKTIENYLNKGGKFYKKEDLKKIYGLKEQDYDRLAPFIKLPEKGNYKDKYRKNTSGKSYLKKEKQQATFEENTVEQIVLSPFNPNELTQEKAIQLGLSPKVGKTIEKYLSKGGKFYKTEDLQKIYGLKQADYERLAPFVELPKKEEKKKEEVKEYTKVVAPLESKEPVNQEIIAKETPAVDPVIPLQNFNPNELNEEQAVALGLSPKVGKTIEKYLSKGGKFYKAADFKKIYGLQEEDFNRLLPYIQIPAPKQKPKKQVDPTPKTASFQAQKQQAVESPKQEKVPIQLHAFNPNKLNQAQAISLGLSPRVGKTIENYLSKGGKFYKKEDFKKIYGLQEADYERLAPYIELPPPASATKSKEVSMKDKEQHNQALSKEATTTDKAPIKSTPDPTPALKAKDSVKMKEQQAKRDYWKQYEALKIDINGADAEKWQELRGIGPSIAGRIIKYRDILGGFTHKEQLLEVYGFSEELYQEVMEKLVNNEQGKVQKIRINEISLSELKKHPYIETKMAKKMIRVREKYGKYESLKALLDFNVMSEEELKKVKGYLEI